MTKNEIIDLLIEGDADSVGKAVKAMRAVLPDDNMLLNLTGQWNRLQKEITANTIPPDRAEVSLNQLQRSFLDIAKKLPVSVQPQPGNQGGVAVGQGSKSSTVFLSYNHKDSDKAAAVKYFLRSKGINVTIDAEAMRPGEDIKGFINNSIRNADVTLSLVSNNSLLSAWVGLETMNTLAGEQISNKRFIAIVIDGSFYEMSFVRTSTEAIEKRLAELKEEMKYRIENDLGIEDLQNERSRNQDLKNDLPKIVANLKERLNIDIIGANFEPGMERVAKAILNP